MTAPSAGTLGVAEVSALIEISQIRHTRQASRGIHAAMRFHRNTHASEQYISARLEISSLVLNEASLHNQRIRVFLRSSA